MQIFAQAAGNSSMPLGGDYVDAAQQIDMSCGSSFVVEAVEQINGAASGGVPPMGLALLTLVVLVVSLVV